MKKIVESSVTWLVPGLVALILLTLVGGMVLMDTAIYDWYLLWPFVGMFLFAVAFGILFTIVWLGELFMKGFKSSIRYIATLVIDWKHKDD